MSEKMAEYITKPFDPILAEEISIMVHKECTCRNHDIGIRLAQLAHEFYSEETLSVQVYDKDFD